MNGIRSFVIFAALCFSCEKTDEDNSMTLACVRGKYLGTYCEGIAIQILDDAKIGKDWISIYTNQEYNNGVVASVDSSLTRMGTNLNSYISADSIFYFQYKDGGYPSKQYNVCEPPPFITVTAISNERCARDVIEL